MSKYLNSKTRLLDIEGEKAQKKAKEALYVYLHKRMKVIFTDNFWIFQFLFNFLKDGFLVDEIKEKIKIALEGGYKSA